MRYVGLVIDEDVKKDMSKEAIMIMNIAAELKAIGIKYTKIQVIKKDFTNKGGN